LQKLDEESARVRIARRIAGMIHPGEVVNLGVGIPTMVADYLKPGTAVLHAENGMLGMGPKPETGQGDPDLINAGRQRVTELPGCCYFDSAMSFAIIRGGHLETTVLGTLEVDIQGSIANWKFPGGGALGVGGAMDLCTGAKRVIIATTLLTKKGQSKIVGKCSLPVTAPSRADVVVTECGVFEKRGERLALTELARETTLEEIRSLVGAPFDVAPDLRPMDVCYDT